MSKPKVLVIVEGGTAQVFAEPGTIEVMFVDRDDDEEMGRYSIIPDEWGELPAVPDNEMVEPHYEFIEGP